MRVTLRGTACQGGVCLRPARWWPGESLRRWWDSPGAWHTLARAADRGALGGSKPDDGGRSRHNLHSVRGGNLVGLGRYAGSPTRS